MAVGVFLVATSAAHAQVQLPQFSISNIPAIDMDSDLAQDYEANFASIDNPMMRDVLRLQYQINLLERLIRRQTEIQRIATSYKNIGLPFKQPPPPQTACEQLPVNILCMAFYPESAKYKGLIAERQEEFRRDQRRQMELMMQQMYVTPTPASAQSGTNQTGAAPAIQTRPAQSPDARYMWSDIRCLAGKCSALLINREDTAMRFRIREDENLPDEGGKITHIQVSGVSAVYKGETVKLQPAAIAGGQQVDPRPNTGDIAQILQGNLGAEAAATSPAIRAAQSDSAIAPQAVVTDNNAPAPMLGVTGLF